MSAESLAQAAAADPSPASTPCGTVHDLFRSVARSQRGAPALVWHGGVMSYGELDARSDGLARALRERAPEGALIGLCVERGPALVVGMLGILKAGMAYVPLDPAYPEPRLRFMLDDTRARLVVAHRETAELLRPFATVLDLDLAASASSPGGQAPASHANAESLAYVCYTSGSTGRPKGALIPHRGVVRLVHEVSYVALGPDETILQLASPSFDATTFEVWGALLNGGRLAFPRSSRPRLDELGDELRAHGVTTLWLTAGLFHLMVDERLDDLRPLRQLLAGGDSLCPERVRRVLRALPDLRLVNGYGPTENTTFTCCHTVRLEDVTDTVPIGRPIDATYVRVLDPEGRPVATGQVGELYTGGEGLGLGYLNLPDLTAERFVEDRLQPGERLYRTGDRVRARADGVLEFLGRVDDQVKIRGVRVEPGEVASALRCVAGVRDAIVVVRRQPGDGEARLVAYALAEPGVSVDEAGLLSSLRTSLPDALVPARAVVLERFPLTNNGKIDRDALPAPAAPSSRSRELRARGAVEEAIAQAWREALRLTDVGAEEDFLLAGGHSLKAAQVAGRVSCALHVDVSVVDVLEARTIAGLARRLEGRPRAERATPLATDLERAPLSAMQSQLWVLERLVPERQVYLVPYAVRLRGRLDVRALARALERLEARHAALRLRWVEEHDGAPAQTVAPAAPVDLAVHELEALDAAGREAELDALVTRAARERLDLRGRPWRASVVRVDAREHVLLFAIHHLVTDGRSMAVLFRDLSALYAHEAGGPAPALAPLGREYLGWCAAQAQRQAEPPAGQLAAGLAYWRKTLEGRLPALELPTDRPRPRRASAAGGAVQVTLDARLVARLGAVAAAQGVTPFVVLLATFQALLSRCARAEDVVVAVPHANRDRPDLEGHVGLFVDMLPIRVSLAGAPSFGELLARVRAATLGAFAHGDVPFFRLLGEVSLDRSDGAAAAFQTMFALLDVRDLTPRFGDLEASVRLVPNGGAKCDLGLLLEERADGEVAGVLEYRCDLFDESTVRRLGSHYVTLLEAGLAEPSREVAALPLLRDDERQQLLVEWNRTEGPFPTERLLHQLFEARVDAAPDALAVTDGDRSWTYGQLEARANQLAHRLLAEGVGRGTRVGICVERSLELVASILAVLKTGAAYVPLDPDHPRERLTYMLEDAAAPALLTQRSLLPRLPDGPAIVCVDDDAPGPVTRPACAAELDDVAYIIYTSGSTGRPKGVVVRHRPALNVIDWVNATFAVSPSDRLLFVTSPCFDLSVYDVLGTLAAGAQLHVARAPLLRDPAQLAALLDQGTITIWDSAPAALAQLEPWLPDGSATGRLRLVMLSGDWIPVALPDRLRRAWADVKVVSLGGATEATIWSNWYPIDAVDPTWTSIPYGRPIRNARYYVLDDRLQPAPVNVAGELWIGGECLADGYLNRPELTAERFVPDPFTPGGKLYRTGDLARFRAGGELELLGRIDSQVKIRGYRIELGEVEAALSQVDGVGACVAAARGERGAERTLVGYVVPRRPHLDLDPQAIRAALAERLPAAMVPTHVVIIDALPLTPNGKLDRAALPAPAPVTRAHEPPRDALEVELAAAFASALRVEQVGVHDDFFALGGHSLAAVRAVAELRRRLNVEVPLPAFFAAPTVAGLKAEVKRLQGGEGAVVAIGVVPREGRRVWPMTSAQRRLWFLERLHGPSPRYTVGVAIDLDGALDVAALRTALDALVARHEALRTTFGEERGAPAQIIAPAASLELPLDDLTTEPDPEGASDAIARAESAWTFDPAIRCTRARLLRLAPRRHRLLFAQHHMVTDGESIHVLLRDLAALYERRTELPPVSVQLADFAVWEQAWLKSDEAHEHLEAWRARLAGAPATQSLPLDLPRRQTTSLRGARCTVELPSASLERLLAVGRAEGATPFVTLLAAFALLLHRRGGDPCVVVNAPVTARRRPELSGAAGFFVNTLPLRVDLEGDLSFRALVARTKATVMDAFARPDVPLDRIVEALRPARDGGGSPFQQVLFMETSDPASVGAGDLRLTPRALPNGGAKYELLLDVTRGERGATAALEFDAELLSQGAAERLLGHLAQLVVATGDAPDAPISSLPLLQAAERHQVLEAWNDTRRDYPRERCVHELLAEFADREPERTAVALVWEEDDGRRRSLSYGALMARARALAAALRRVGVGPDVPVGVFLERSPELVVALVAALEAGGAYLPLDPDYPADRLTFIVDDARAPVVITSAALAPRLPAGRHRVLLVDEPHELADAPPAGARPTADSLAYLIYTSGSTGRPKGVAVTHRGVVRLVRGADYVAFGPAETHLLLAPVSFDASTFELWGALLNGGRLALAPRGPVSLEAIGRTIRRLGVTTLWLTAGLFQAMVDERLQDLGPLRQLVTGGDVVSPAHARQVLESLPHLRLVNGYGPTECTTFACCHTVRLEDVAAGGAIPIGRPISNTRAYVVDARGAPLPIGDAGQLWLGGDGVARGYLARPELTAERFAADPFVPGGVVYRTGDLARWRADGLLEFLGRMDRQVKVRGHRVEPGELEAVLAEHDDVRDAAVVVQQGPDGKALGAFVVAREGAAPDPAALLAWLRRRVPAHLLPARIEALASLPLDPNGKVDRRALAAHALTTTRPHRPPRDDVERALAAIWSALLGAPRVGLDDDFFALGGHSLLALRLSARVEAELSHALPIAAIFAAPTLEALAEVVRRREGATGLVVPLDSRGAGAPLFVFPGIGGHPFTFRALAQHLGGQRPVLGLQAIGLDGKEKCPTRLADIAGRYVRELRQVRPEGPYLLAGYSFGGIVAFEVAARLRALGAQVDLVALIDSPAPGYPGKRPLLDRLRLHAKQLFGGTWKRRARWVVGRLRSAVRRLGLLPTSKGPPPADSTMAARIDAVRAAQWRALNRVCPTAGMDAPLLVIRAAAKPIDPFHMYHLPEVDPLLGWGTYATGPVRSATVPGAHLEMFGPGNVEALAAAFREALSPPEAAQPASERRAA